jgi:hypothetical protein
VKPPHATGDLDSSLAARAGHDVGRLIPHLVFLLIALAEVIAIGIVNHGSITYTLDDAYIHLALAERISGGTYGINAGEFAAPASSILWPLILSPFSKFGFFALLPCVLNLAAALGSLMIMARVVYRALEGASDAVSVAWTATFVTLLIPATNLVGLAFTGMEHSLQQLLAVAVVAGLIDESRTNRVPRYLWVAVVLLPLVRYDSLALSVPTLIYLARRSHLRGSILAAVLLVSILGAFSWFLKSNGLGFLPTSVMAKSDIMRTSGSVGALLLTLYGNIVLSPQGNLLLLGTVFLVSAALNSSRPNHERGLALTVGMALALHLTFGRVGAYFRYEAYLAAAAILTLIHLHRDWLHGAFRAGGSVASRVAATGSLVAVSMGYAFALASTPLAANNIYDQQYQLHRFVVDYYKGPVAVNDLGQVAFRNPYYVLDFWGLGSAEAQRYRLHEPGGQWMQRLCREHGVELILIYDDWFPNRPASWVRLGHLKLLRPKITPAEADVQFYARDEASAERVRAALSSFSGTLPDGAAFVATTDPNSNNTQP